MASARPSHGQCPPPPPPPQPPPPHQVGNELMRQSSRHIRTSYKERDQLYPICNTRARAHTQASPTPTLPLSRPALMHHYSPHVVSDIDKYICIFVWIYIYQLYLYFTSINIWYLILHVSCSIHVCIIINMYVLLFNTQSFSPKKYRHSPALSTATS